MLKAVGNANLLVAIGDFDIFLVENRHFFYLRFKRSAWLLRTFLCKNYGRRWRFLDAMAPKNDRSRHYATRLAKSYVSKIQRTKAFHYCTSKPV